MYESRRKLHIKKFGISLYVITSKLCPESGKQVLIGNHKESHHCSF